MKKKNSPEHKNFTCVLLPYTFCPCLLLLSLVFCVPLRAQAQTPQPAKTACQLAIEELKDKISALEKENAVLNSLAKLEPSPQGALREKKDEVILKDPSELSPSEQGKIYANLGYLYSLQGNYKLAIKIYQLSLNYLKDDKDTYYNLGFLYAKTGKFKQAAECYKQALEGTKRDKDIYYNLAIISSNHLHDQNSAAAYYKKMLEIKND